MNSPKSGIIASKIGDVKTSHDIRWVYDGRSVFYHGFFSQRLDSTHTKGRKRRPLALHCANIKNQNANQYHLIHGTITDCI